MVCLDTDWATIAESPTEGSQVLPRPENPAYVIYTSGSTGEPKGVEIKHRICRTSCAPWRENLGLRLGQAAGRDHVSFDIAGLEIFLPFTTGATVNAPACESRRSPLRTSAELTRRHRHAGDACDLGAADRGGWTGDRDFRYCAAERRSRLRWQMNCCCVRGALEHLWPHGDDDLVVVRRIRTGQPNPIGRPIANTQFYIVDRSGNPSDRRARRVADRRRRAGARISSSARS